jgi:uncharacterized membrane protein YbhN (UPF0104 family)
VSTEQTQQPHENTKERLNRNFNELLQELRVAQAGVQILFGFLLSITFTDRYTSVGDYVRTTHLVTVLFSALAVAFLTAPAAWHRLLFRLGQREEILRAANGFAIAGLACLATAMTGTVLLLGEMIVGGWGAIVLGVFAALVFSTLWFTWPLKERRSITDDD